jgi:hypothetical protein
MKQTLCLAYLLLISIFGFTHSAHADDIATVCQAANISQMPDTYWDAIPYYLQAHPGNYRVNLDVNFAPQGTILPQRITVQLPDNRTFQCIIMNPVQGKTMMSYDWIEPTPFQTKFRVEAFNQGAWHDWGCVDRPLATQRNLVTITYDCGGVSLVFSEHPDTIQVPTTPLPLPIPHPHPGAPANACSSHGGLTGHKFDNTCIVLVETCHDYDLCVDGSKQYTSGYYACGVCFGFSF